MRRQTQKAFLLCFMALLIFGFLMTPMLQTQAEITLQSKTTLVKNFSGIGNLKGVDQTNNGSVFASVDGDIWRSDDLGVSWMKVKDMYSGATWQPLIIPGTNTIIAFELKEGTSNRHHAWRSADYGLTWTKVIDGGYEAWKLTQMANGSIYMGTYPNTAAIYKSSDDGQTWSVWKNFTGEWTSPQHVHTLRVNPKDNYLWAAFGDGNGAPCLGRYDGSSWTYFGGTISGGTGNAVTDITFLDDGKAVLFPDAATLALQIVDEFGTSRTDVFKRADDSSSITYFQSMYGARYSDGLIVAPIDAGKVYASANGTHWLKIFDTTIYGTWGLDSVTQRAVNGYWYFINDQTDSVYRSTVNAADVDALWTQTYLTSYFNAVGQDIPATQLQFAAENNTEILVDLSDSSASEYVLSVTGLSRGNMLSNPSFETQDLSGWNISWSGSVDVLLGGNTPPNGVALSDNTGGVGFWDANENGLWDVGESAINDTNVDGIYETGVDAMIFGSAPPNDTLLSFGDARYYDGNLDSAWSVGEPAIQDVNNNYFYEAVAVHPSYSVVSSDKYNGSYSLKVSTTTNDTHTFILTTQIPQNLYVYAESWSYFYYGRATSTGYIKSGIGYVDDNNVFRYLSFRTLTQSTSWLKKTGNTVQSSTRRQIYLRLELATGAVRDFYIDAFVLHRSASALVSALTDNKVTYRYGYMAPTLPAVFYTGVNKTHDVTVSLKGYANAVVSGDLEENQTQHFVYELTSKIFNVNLLVGGSKQVLLTITYSSTPYPLYSTAVISEAGYDLSKLKLHLSSYSGSTSTTEIYCGDMGEPTKVYGAISHSFDSAAKLLTITNLHSNQARILIFWKLVGDIDGDNDVDANDLHLFAAVYGSHLGDPSYNSSRDIDWDGDIDASDLKMLAENYGKQ